MKIRNYKNSDFSMLLDWYRASNDALPPEGLFVEDGTFIAENENIPLLCLSVLLTQSKQVGYLMAYIGNPEFKGPLRKEAGKILWNHCFDYAKSKGYKHLLCFTDREKLKIRYENLGMKNTMSGLYSFVKEL